MKTKKDKLKAAAAVRCNAWLGRDGECCIPHRLLHESEQNRERDGEQGDADGNPRPDGVWAAQAPLQLSLAEQALPPSGAIVPSGNPLAKLLVRLGAKLVGVEFWFHGYVLERPNVQTHTQEGRRET